MSDISHVHAAPVPPRRSPDDGFRLATHDALDYFHAVWAWRRATVVAMVALAVLGATWSLTSPRRYEASVTVAVMPSKLSVPGVPAASVANFAPIVTSYAAVAPVVKEFKLADPPRELTPTQFINVALEVKPLVETNLLRVIVELDDPDLAARVSNRLVQNAIAISRDVNEKDVGGTLNELKIILDLSETRMKEAETRYDAYRRSAQLELLRKDVETLLGQRGDLKKVLVEIEAERGKVAQGEAELVRRKQTLTVRRNIDSDSALLTITGERVKPDASVLGLELNTEVLNQVYQEIDTALAQARAKLTSLEKQRDQLLKGAGVGANELARLNDLYTRESAMSRLELERNIARKSYEDIAARYQTAHLEAIGRMSQVVVVDTAVPPDRPVSRLLVRNVALGILTGLLFGLVLAAADLLRGGRVARA